MNDINQLRKVSQKMLIANAGKGDFGLILSDNFFSTLQNWYRKKIDKAPNRASHAFFVYDPPDIIEANGLYIKQAGFLKYIGDKTKCWFFRYKNLTSTQLDRMIAYAEGAADNGGTYSISGIIQFALRFIGVKKNITNEPGSFCSEFDSNIIKDAGLTYLDKKSYEITPSVQLSYMLADGSPYWDLVGYYDGNGGYFIR
jgi:hypothetical protein